jgi:hypothetical protein
MVANDAFADATAIIKRADQQYHPPAYSTVGLSTEVDEPGGGYRSAWWSYTPTEDGGASAFSIPFDYVSLLSIYTGTTLTDLIEVAASPPEGGSVGWTITPNTTYWIRLAQPDDADMELRLILNGPSSELENTVHGELTIFGPPSLGPYPESVLTPYLTISAYPVSITDLPPEVPDPDPVELPERPLLLPRAALTCALARVVLTAPDNNATVPLAAPTFTLGVQVYELAPGDIVTVTVQYDTVPEFTSPLSLLGSPDTSLGLAPVVLRGAPTTGVLYWRAQVLLNDVPVTAWTPTRTLTLAAAAAQAATVLSWTVDPDADPAPHLWFLNPAVGVPGDEVTLTGLGFPTDPMVRLSGIEATITDQITIAATTTAAQDWVIDPIEATADPEHEQITVLIPDAPPPGGPIIITGES